ncbi:MAG: hypothetical protein C0404_08515 [Verrucomicrobia bacterium]|nr:hypothetical protein [Verrucomicrobiota bacterium]
MSQRIHSSILLTWCRMRCRPRRPADCAGFSLVELVVIIVISGIVMSALMIGFYAEARNLQAQKAIRDATGLADDLMNEIRTKAFSDPLAPNSWAEQGTNRVNFNDVDDYDGLSNAPPMTIEGLVMTNYGGYTCMVNVTNVPHADFNATGNYPHGSTDFLKIIVTARNRDLTLTNVSVVSKYD